MFEILFDVKLPEKDYNAVNQPTNQPRQAGHCLISKDELKSDILRLISSHGRVSVGQPARTYLQQFRIDTECSLEDLPGSIHDRDEWHERVKEIRASDTG